MVSYRNLLIGRIREEINRTGELHFDWDDVITFERFIRGTDAKRKFVNTIISSMRPPPESKTQWAEPFEGQRLSLFIIEPRKTPLLAPVLYNAAHIYGGSEDVSLYIFHGTENEEFVEDIVQGWDGVQLVNLGVDNLKYPDGPNSLLLNQTIYETFKSEYVLSFQTDSLMRRKLEDKFFGYGYIGGPWHEELLEISKWHEDINIEKDRRIGNGGFSLRRVKEMIQLSNSNLPLPKGWKQKWEDQFIAKSLPLESFPDLELAKEFCSDSIFHPDPVGVHQIYSWFKLAQILQFFSNVPGLPVYTPFTKTEDSE